MGEIAHAPELSPAKKLVWQAGWQRSGMGGGGNRLFPLYLNPHPDYRRHVQEERRYFGVIVPLGEWKKNLAFRRRL